MSNFEQKPKTWALFPMSDEDVQKKEDFYYDKGWDMDKVPSHSGKLVLEDGTVVRLEGRFIEGQRGAFLAGSCYVPQSQGNGNREDRGGREPRRDDNRRSDRGNRDDRGGRDDRNRGRDDRRNDRDDRGARGNEGQRSFADDYSDDIPF